MLVAILFVAIELSAGYAAARVLGLTKGAPAVALVCAIGLGATSVLATWVGMVGIPAPGAGVVILACVVTGLVLLVHDRDSLGGSILAFARQDRLAAVLLALAILVPIVSMGVAFAQVQAPLSPHDGAFHVETADAFRRGSVTATWYPPGLAALFGGILQLTPWIDTAAGGYGLGVGLTLLAPLLAFGLGAAVWRNLQAAAAGALLLSLTHLFPYYPQIWSGWPQLQGILLVAGLWIVAIGYLEVASWKWALVAGILVGAIVLVHGTELYTIAIVLVVLVCANWRRLPWLALVRHAPTAIVLAVVCAAPYLPLLLHWAGGGGAYQAGFEDGTALENGASSSALQLLVLFVLDGLGVDFPIRIVLVGFGIAWVVRRRVGGTVLAVTAVFVALAVIATLFNFVPLVRTIFAATYPWSLPYRHLTFASLTLALLAGAGWVLAGEQWARLLRRVRGVAAHRRLFRIGRLLVGTWLVLAMWALVVLLSIEAGEDVSFTADDAAAMAWLRANVPSDAVVVNDPFADAGMWAPYKAGVRILFYRSFDDPTTAEQRGLIVANIADLDQNHAAAAAACALSARYVYYGAANAAWQARTFPPVEQLVASSALQEVFRHGEAHVFATRLNC